MTFWTLFLAQFRFLAVAYFIDYITVLHITNLC